MTTTTSSRPTPDYLYRLVNRSLVDYARWQGESQERAQRAVQDIVGCTIYEDGAFGFVTDRARLEAEQQLRAVGWKGRFIAQGPNPKIPDEYIELASFESYGAGWRWEIASVRWDDMTCTWKTFTKGFRTNRFGEGLWEWDRQVLGTCQFGLPADEKKARRIVRERHFVGAKYPTVIEEEIR